MDSLEDVCRQLSPRNNLIVIRHCTADAIASAERVLGMFETDNPEDKKPRKALEAARGVGEVIDRYLAGQTQWQEVEAITEAVWEAGNAVSEQTLYTAKPWSAWLAADAVCHTAHTAGEATGKAVEAIRNAACAAASAAVSSWLAETGEKQSKADEWKMVDDVYYAKQEELCHIAKQLLVRP